MEVKMARGVHWQARNKYCCWKTLTKGLLNNMGPFLTIKMRVQFFLV